VKKAILIFAAMLMVVSGVAAVSAYEAHTINVKCKVENALSVSGDADMELGTIFPEEFFIKHWTVGISNSFAVLKGLEEPDPAARVNYVLLDILIEEKLKTDPDGSMTDGTIPPASGDETWYNWMGAFTYIGKDVTDDQPEAGIDLMDTGWNLIGARPAGPAPVVSTPVWNDVRLGVQSGGLTQEDSFIMSVAVDAPVFEGYYNYYTDPKPKPSGKDVPTCIIPKWLDPPTNTQPNPLWVPGGVEFGLDVKIQVVDILKEVIPTP
jgi:hypothetical protein